MKNDGSKRTGTFVFLCIFCCLAVVLAVAGSLGVFSDRDGPSGTSAREIAQGSPSAGVDVRKGKSTGCAEGLPCQTVGQFCFPDPGNRNPESELFCDMANPKNPKFRKRTADELKASQGGMR